jgi:hypothetical protein
VAPGAQVVLVTDAYNSNTAPTNDPIYDDAQWAIANAFVTGSPVYGTRILSSSYGLCELVNTTATNVAYNNLWQTAYAAGIAVFVASGDGGAATCDFTLGGDSIGNPYEAQFGTTVNGNASTPYNTAVGGTDFSWCQPTVASSGEVVGCSSSNASTYWNASNSSQQSSAKTDVPETPWNDSCENPLNAAYLESIAAYFAANGVNLGTFSTPEETCNLVYQDYATIYEDAGVMLAPLVDTVGGGGGVSSCVVNSSPSIYGATYSGPGTCSSSATSYGSLTLVNDGWPKPSWQTGVTGIPADGVRDLPDVSFFAGNGGFDSATLVCVSNDGATCSNIADTACFNAGTCTGGAEEIGGTSVATPEMAGVMALINENAGAPQGNPNAVLYSLAAKQTYSECSAEGPPSSSCYFNSVDKGTNTQPCAVSALDLEGGAIFDPQTGSWEPGQTEAAIASPNCSIVNSGDVIGTLAGYSAATGYNQANGLGSLNVANVINAGVWTAVSGTKAATVAINLGGVTTISEIQSLNVTVTVSGASGTPTGTVALTATNTSEYSSEQVLSGGTATFTIPANTFTSIGTATLTASYSGSSTYATGSNTATIVVNLPPDFEVGNSGAISITAGATTGNTTTFYVEPVGGFTGTVNLTCAIAPVNGGVSPPTCTVGSPAVVTSAQNVTETVTVTSSTSTTQDGYTLTVTGTSGTDVHTSAIGMAIISAVGSTSTYTVSATTPGSISPGSNATSTITAQGSGGYTGSVTLGCSLMSSPSGASDLPGCSVTSGSPVSLSAGTTSGQATATVTTTPATADLIYPKVGKGKGWLGAGSGAVLAVLIFFGIPARRRSWRNLLGILVVMGVIGTLSSCGGGGGGGKTNGNPGTTAGTYTFTVTATGSPAVTPTPTTTFTVTVN